MLHQKGDGVAAFATAKALEKFFAGRYGEGGRFFVVKGAQTYIIAAAALEFHKFAYHLYYIKAANNPLYRVLCYQCVEAFCWSVDSLGVPIILLGFIYLLERLSGIMFCMTYRI